MLWNTRHICFPILLNALLIPTLAAKRILIRLRKAPGRVASPLLSMGLAAAILSTCPLSENWGCRTASAGPATATSEAAPSEHRADGNSDVPLLPGPPNAPAGIPLAPGSSSVTIPKPDGILVPDQTGLSQGSGTYEGMVLIPAGTFEMGNQETRGRIDEQPAHKVFLKDFYLGKQVITVAQYCEYLNTAGLKGKDGSPRIKIDSPHCPIVLRRNKFVPKEGEVDLPMVCVSYYGASDYAHRAGGRLPTEAEWEKAAWMTTPHPPGDSVEVLSRESSVPVESALPGFNGVTGMVGNVWQWCSDWYAADYYASCPLARPTGPALGKEKVIRGGSWASAETSRRIRNRHRAFPRGYYKTVGFRIVKD